MMISVVLSLLVWIPAGLSQQSNQLCQKSPYGYPPNSTFYDPARDAKEEDAIKIVNYATNYSTIEFLLDDDYELNTWTRSSTVDYNKQNHSTTINSDNFTFFADIPREKNAVFCVNDTFYIKRDNQYETIIKMWLSIDHERKCPDSLRDKNDCTATGLSAAECAYSLKPSYISNTRVLSSNTEYALPGDPQDFYYAKLDNHLYPEYETLEVGQLLNKTDIKGINDTNKLVCSNFKDIHRIENNIVIGLPIVAFTIIKNVISNCNMSVYNSSLQNDGIKAEDAISIKQTSFIQKIIEFKASTGTATMVLYDKKQSKVSTKNYPLKKFKNEKGQIVCKDNEWVFTRENNKPELVVKQLVVSAREN